MANFTRFTHIERLGKADTDGILNNPNVAISAKMDGSNASVYYKNGKIECASRSRQLSETKDNGGFYVWVNGTNEEAIALREFLMVHHNYIIYGEWMGYNKFLGSIKQYNQEALNRMFVFDVYDVEKEEYLPDEEWREMLLKYGFEESWFAKLFGVFDNPTMEQVEEIAANNKFMLDNANVRGEGVVVKAPGFINCYGRACYGKLVLAEFSANKGRKQVEIVPGEVEKNIVETYLTDAELTKNAQKTCVWADVDEFDKKNGKMIGFFLNLCYQESILEECKDWVKRFKNPKVDFKILNNLSNVKGRTFLGF